MYIHALHANGLCLLCLFPTSLVSRYPSCLRDCPTFLYFICEPRICLGCPIYRVRFLYGCFGLLLITSCTCMSACPYGRSCMHNLLHACIIFQDPHLLPSFHPMTALNRSLIPARITESHSCHPLTSSIFILLFKGFLPLHLSWVFTFFPRLMEPSQQHQSSNSSPRR